MEYERHLCCGRKFKRRLKTRLEIYARPFSHARAVFLLSSPLLARGGGGVGGGGQNRPRFLFLSFREPFYFRASFSRERYVTTSDRDNARLFARGLYHSEISGMVQFPLELDHRCGDVEVKGTSRAYEKLNLRDADEIRAKCSRIVANYVVRPKLQRAPRCARFCCSFR